MSKETDEIDPREVAEGVDALTWPKAQFDHRGHLAAGAWWCHVFGSAALDHARTAIRRFNEANGGENTDTAGYHETLTVYYLAALADLIADDVPDRAWLAANIESPLVEQAAPLRYWSEPVLMGSEARKRWVAPDVRDLPAGVQARVDPLRGS